MNVYLYELDIDEYGSEVSLLCLLDEYISKFIFFVDTVYFQPLDPHGRLIDKRLGV